MTNSSNMSLLLAALLVLSGECRAESFQAANQLNTDSPTEDLWRGTATFKEVRKLQIQSNGPVASTVAAPILMNSGTQIVAMSNFVPTSRT